MRAPVAHKIAKRTTNDPRLYQIDFALITLTGNRTRYETVRPLVEQDASVRAHWHPIRSWVHGDWISFLPARARVRARHVLDSRRFLLFPAADAIVIHAFETYTLYALMHRLRRHRAVVVAHYDGPSNVPGPKPGLGGRFHQMVANETDLFVPWSSDAAAVTRRLNPELGASKLMVLHPGIDLQRWPMRKTKMAADRFRLLFVGGDLVRKGIETLLAAVESQLGPEYELDVATQRTSLTPALERRLRGIPNIRVHLDLLPGSAELRELYARADAFVLPTDYDNSPWVAMEAMATGVPVVITPVGGIPDIVENGRTGIMIPPRDPRALAAAVATLRSSDELARRLAVSARAHLEANFDARQNTPKLLDTIKELVREKRARTSPI